MAGPSSTLRLGAAAPDFKLCDALTGETESLASLLDDRAGLLLVFHRGLW